MVNFRNTQNEHYQNTMEISHTHTRVNESTRVELQAGGKTLNKLSTKCKETVQIRI